MGKSFVSGAAARKLWPIFKQAASLRMPVVFRLAREAF